MTLSTPLLPTVLSAGVALGRCPGCCRLSVHCILVWQRPQTACTHVFSTVTIVQVVKFHMIVLWRSQLRVLIR